MLDSKLSEKELLVCAASVEAHSEHLIAQGIINSAKENQKVQDFKAIPGKGARGVVKGEEVLVVSPGYLREKKIEIQDGKIETLNSQEKTFVYVLIDGAAAGAIALADIIRPESKEAVMRLKKMGIRTMMLTGDNEGRELIKLIKCTERSLAKIALGKKQMGKLFNSQS